MGAGKTSVGKRLAALLGVPFIDSDAEIVEAAGMTIPEIFATLGEPAFRDGERRVIARLLSEAPGVLATGGGAFIEPRTRAEIAGARHLGLAARRPRPALGPGARPPRPAAAAGARPARRARRPRPPPLADLRRGRRHRRQPARRSATRRWRADPRRRAGLRRRPARRRRPTWSLHDLPTVPCRSARAPTTSASAYFQQLAAVGQLLRQKIDLVAKFVSQGRLAPPVVEIRSLPPLP